MQNPSFTDKITRIDRMQSSANGNPRFMITFADHGSYPTEVDAGLAYGINNPEYRRGLVHVWIVTKRGRENITYVTPAEG